MRENRRENWHLCFNDCHDHKLVLVLVYCLAHTVDLSLECEIRSDDICNNKTLIFISHINKDLPLIDL